MNTRFFLIRPRVLVAALACIAVCLPPLRVTAQPPNGQPQTTETGLSVNQPAAYQGYSVVAPMSSTATYLIDMDGRVIHQWQSEFTPALSAYLLENGHLLRPGSQRGGSSIGGPGSGGRIQEFDWDGNLVWDFSFSTERNHPHHDICPMPNGNVLTIAWDKKTPEEAVAAGRIAASIQREFLPDCIFEVKPTGKTTGEIVWEWHAWDHLIQEVDEAKPNYGEVSEHPERIDINFGTNVIAEMVKDPEQLAKLRSLGYVGDSRGQAGRGNGRGPGAGGAPMDHDWMHTNSVAYNPELDQIMLSIHSFSEVWIIDHSTTTEDAASHEGGRYKKGGDLLYRWGNPRAYRNGSNIDRRLFAQHCANWIPKGMPGEGHMLVFNNGAGRPDGTYSSVDEIVLPVDKDGNYSREEFLPFGPERATWSYSAPEKSRFFSMNISGAQRLPNRNTLVCSGAAGVLFEVTDDKETVWQYSMPHQGPAGHRGPAGRMGPGGPLGAGPPQPGELLPAFLQEILQMNDDQKAKLADLQGSVTTQLKELLTEEQFQRFQAPLPFGAGGPPGLRNPDPRQDVNPAQDQRTQRRNQRTQRRNERPGGGGFTPPRPGEVIPSMISTSLELSETQASQLARIQKRVDAQLATILNDEQKSQLEDLQQGNARGPNFGGPGFGPPNRGPGFGPPGFGPPGFGPPGFGPRAANDRRADTRAGSGVQPSDRPGFRGGDNGPNQTDNRDGGPGFGPGAPGFGPGGRGGGPGGRGGGPGGPGGGPGGIFTCYRYGPEYPGLAGKDLEPGEKLVDVIGSPEGSDGSRSPRPNR